MGITMEIESIKIKSFMMDYANCCELNYHCQCNQIFKDMVNYIAECGVSIVDDNEKSTSNVSEVVVADNADDLAAVVA